MMRDDDIEVYVRQLEPVDRLHRHLACIRVPPPAHRHIAVIFDLSDSHSAAINDLLHRLERLLALGSRADHVWFHRLSSDVPLDDGDQITVGKLLDKTCNVQQLLSGRQMRTAAQGQGSFAAPAIRGIHQRAWQSGIQQVQVLIITDGDLTDFTPVEVPSGLRVIGITATPRRRPGEHWHRAFPTCPLYSLDMPALDDQLNMKPPTFYAECVVGISSAGTTVNASVVDVTNATLKPIVDGTATWNFQHGPLYLFMETDQKNLNGVSLRVEHLSMRKRANVSLDRPCAGEPDIFATAERAIASIKRGSADLVARIAPDEMSAFSDLADAIITAADARRRLALDAIPHGTSEAVLPCDALLCVRQVKTNIAELFRLSRGANPAIHWHAGHNLFSEQTTHPFRIWWSAMESRWFYRIGDDSPRELNPNGAQRIATVPFPANSEWIFAFSGNLID